MDPNANLDDIRNENLSYNKEFTVQLDYVEPIGDKAKLEMGLKNISRNVSSDFQLFRRPEGGSFEEVEGAGVSNLFDYVQKVSAGYVSGLFELPADFTVQAGGRYEYTTITANFSDEVDLQIPDYGVFTPSLNLSKKLKNSNTLKFGYSRRIQRPSLQFLNPNRDASNPLDISQGNPNLLPEFTDQVELSYSRFRGAVSINMSTFITATAAH